MTKYTEITISAALQAIFDGLSVRKAAVQYGIPYTTLRDRTKGARPYKQAAEHLQQLSRRQEDDLASWIVV